MTDTFCDVCKLRKVELDIEPFMTNTQTGYDSSVSICKCQPCYYCHEIHEGACKDKAEGHNVGVSVDANIVKKENNDVTLIYKYSDKCGCAHYQPKDYQPLPITIPCMEHRK